MGKISTFTYVSLDGFYAGPNGEIDWFKGNRPDAEYDQFTHEGSKSGNTLIFGRATYEIMKSYWPTPDAVKSDPDMAEVVNSSPKIVFSKTLRKVDEGAHWKNIKLLQEIRAEEIVELKEQEDKGMTILGSGTIIQQLSNLGLVDEYGLLIIPVILGVGRPLFKDVKKASLDLLETRSFQNGIVWLRYRPALTFIGSSNTFSEP
jgi:dihydrofolate reductase